MLNFKLDTMNILQDDSFFNLSLNINCIANTEGVLLKVNHQYEKALGYSKNELCW